ncbi:hypothetical protein HYDPIDRAFT_119697, partial [Hydnomerulius pinastri MD-312]
MDFGGGKVVAFNFMPVCREMPKLGTLRGLIPYNVDNVLDRDHRRISFAVSYVGCMSVLTLTPGEIFSGALVVRRKSYRTPCSAMLIQEGLA